MGADCLLLQKERKTGHQVKRDWSGIFVFLNCSVCRGGARTFGGRCTPPGSVHINSLLPAVVFVGQRAGESERA